jgi:hypothetical protein
MSDSNSGTPGAQTLPVPVHPPFPLVRLFYAIGFAIVAWFVLWLLLVLTAAQFAIVAINGEVNAELKSFCANLSRYLWQLLGYIVFAKDERPFPFTPFPKAD